MTWVIAALLVFVLLALTNIDRTLLRILAELKRRL